MRILQVGDVVELKVECMMNPIGTRGVVYETYDLGDGPSASIIFENGEYCGFSPDEQNQMVNYLCRQPLLTLYEFKNVMRLTMDFQNGVFEVGYLRFRNNPEQYVSLPPFDGDVNEALRGLVMVCKEVASMAGKDWLRGQLILAKAIDHYERAIKKDDQS